MRPFHPSPGDALTWPPAWGEVPENAAADRREDETPADGGAS